MIKSGCDEGALWFDDDAQGGALISFDAVGIHGLVIRQTRQVIDEVEVLLAGLRQLRRKEPAIHRKIKRVKVESQGGGYSGGGSSGGDFFGGAGGEKSN